MGGGADVAAGSSLEEGPGVRIGSGFDAGGGIDEGRVIAEDSGVKSACLLVRAVLELSGVTGGRSVFGGTCLISASLGRGTPSKIDEILLCRPPLRFAINYLVGQRQVFEGAFTFPVEGYY